jgi:hypothetical protein
MKHLSKGKHLREGEFGYAGPAHQYHKLFGTGNSEGPELEAGLVSDFILPSLLVTNSSKITGKPASSEPIYRSYHKPFPNLSNSSTQRTPSELSDFAIESYEEDTGHTCEVLNRALVFFFCTVQAEAKLNPQQQPDKDFSYPSLF